MLVLQTRVREGMVRIQGQGKGVRTVDASKARWLEGGLFEGAFPVILSTTTSPG